MTSHRGKVGHTDGSLARFVDQREAAKPLSQPVNDMLIELNALYSEMGQKATTDFSEIRAHGNEIVNILEIKNRLVYFKQDKDWFYRAEERRWITMNDNSGWRKIERAGRQMKKTILHIS